MSLLADAIATATEEEPIRGALTVLLDAAATDPTLLERARQDPIMTPIRSPMEQALETLQQHSEQDWDIARGDADAALESSRAWMRLSDAESNDRQRALEELLERASRLIKRGDPFAFVEASGLLDTLPNDARELAADARQRLDQDTRGRAAELHRLVDDATVELKASREWVEASRIAGECDKQLADLADAEAPRAIEIIDSVCHLVAVHEERLEVTDQEIFQRDRLLAEEREAKHLDDRRILEDVRGRIPTINLQLLGTLVLAGLLIGFWRLLPVAFIPAVFAILRTMQARAIFRDRRWSIPMGDVDTVENQLNTRMLIAGLFIFLVVIEMVILWMSSGL